MTTLSISHAPSGWVRDALDDAQRVTGFGTDVGATIDWCVGTGLRAPSTGGPPVLPLWELLAATAALDVAAARMLEPHLDALGILHQAGSDPGDDRRGPLAELIGADRSSSWGVFAAESPGLRLEARPSHAGWTLSGTKPWCSLAAHLSHALVTAHVGASRRLFAVDLRTSRVHAHDGPWFARGLPQVVSAPVDFDEAVAVPVGEAEWYLSRPGFSWGGMAVAACWWGGAVGLLTALAAPARSERGDQLALAHLGRADAELWGARATLAEAAALIDSASVADEKLLAARVRSVVVDAATRVLAQADLALGPAPLVTDLGFARRTADLHLYLRQHHGDRDLARLGRMVADADSAD